MTPQFHKKKSAAKSSANSEKPEISEEMQVEERTSIGPHIVYEAICREGEEELQRTPSALAWSGLAAGLSMGFSFVAEALFASSLPDRPWRPLIAKLGYSVGFLIVVLGRQQLFTENTLTVILPLLREKTVANVLRVLRLWGSVLAANLVGTLLFAWCVARTGVFRPEIQQTFLGIGQAQLGASFFMVMLRAIFAGWLIALMVWLLPAADSARVSIIVIITYLIGLGGFFHVVAGSTEILYLVVVGKAGWTTYLTMFLIPVLIGNIIGGVSLVAALGHAQVVAGHDN